MKTYQKSLRLAAFGLILIVGLYWIWLSGSQDSSPADIQSPQAGFLAPEINLGTTDSSQLTSESFKGRAVILNFWASWCPPCRAEMPDFQQASEEFSSSDLLFIGVNAANQDTLANVMQFMQENAITFPVALDLEGIAARDFQVHSLPTTFFIDKNGIVQKVVIGGPLPLPYLRIEAANLLEATD